MSSTDFRFFHVADLHLDTPFKGLRTLPQRLKEQLQNASLQALDNLLRVAISSKVDAVLIAGDIYDGEERGLRAQLKFLDILERLSQAQIPVFIVHGNHDPLSGWSAISKWPEHVHVFSADTAETKPLLRDNQIIAEVSGISYARAAVTEDLSLRFPRPSRELFHIALLHASVGAALGSGSGGHEPYSPTSIETLSSHGYDYWALGHIHLRQTLRQDSPCIVYPGSIQGRSIKPSECGAKGGILVEVQGRRVKELTFVPLDVVRFQRLEIPLDGIEDVAELKSILLARGREMTVDGRSLIIRGTLTGSRSENLRLNPQLLDELAASCYEEFNGKAIAWESLDDRSRAHADLHQVLNRGDFSSEVVRLGYALAEEVRTGNYEMPQELFKPVERFPQRFFEEQPESCLGRVSAGLIDQDLIEDALKLAVELLQTEGA